MIAALKTSAVQLNSMPSGPNPWQRWKVPNASLRQPAVATHTCFVMVLVEEATCGDMTSRAIMVECIDT